MSREVRCPVDVVWDDRFLDYSFGASHPFTQKSRHLAVRLLEESEFFPQGKGGPVRTTHAPVASETDLLRFHDRSYIELVRRVGHSSHPGLLDRGDTPGFKGCHEAAARIVGGTLLGLESVLSGRGGHAINPAGGLHHAAPGGASGFCIYDDVAIAIAAALEGPHRVKRVAYVDIDAHHGDGVMYGFYGDGRVLDIDFHQDGRTLFPGTGFVHETGKGDGKGLKVNVPLPPTAGDEALVPLFGRIVPKMLRSFRPDLIVLQTGVDAHAGDPLAHLQYTPKAYEFAIGTVHDLSHELCEGRLLETGGGGYLAMNVSRVLARAAAHLAQDPLGAAGSDRLPASWRSEFERVTGDPAPTTWGETAPLYDSRWTSEMTEKMLELLGKELGVAL
jgi:acetoin utilization protein AcuC